MSAAPRAEAVRVELPYHPHSRRNPYQRTLYSTSASAGIRPRRLPDRESLFGLPGSRGAVLHLHWTDTILAGAAGEEEARGRVERLRAGLARFRDEGGRLIWTVHNALPHESRFPALEPDVCAAIVERADAVHVMCEATTAAVAPWYELPANRVTVIPHPSYLGVYPNYVSRTEARARLGFGPEHTVLAVVGGIRRYKALMPLLDAFDAARSRNRSLRLVIAGRPIRFGDLDALRERTDAHPAVMLRLGGIPLRDIQLYLNAADALVLPHRATLNSGLVALAHSFGRPVIAPETGCIASQVTAGTGRLVAPGDPQALVDALSEAGDLKDPAFERATLEWAHEHAPATIAPAFADLVLAVAAGE